MPHAAADGLLNAHGLDPGFFAVTVLAALSVGYATVHVQIQLIAAAVVGPAVVIAAIALPEAVLIVWFTAILADGRWLTYHQMGPLFVTELLLAVLVAAVSSRFLLGQHPRALRSSPGGTRLVVWLLAVLWVPALLGLLVRTHSLDYVAARNFTLILYSLFAVIVAVSSDVRSTYRRWFAAVLLGSTVALLLLITGHAGQPGLTSTGAVRFASYSFPVSFGLAPIVLIAAARERLIRPLVATLAAVPFFVGLVFTNQRSAWVAFLAAAVVLFARRISMPVIVGSLATLAAAGVLLTMQTSSQPSTLGEEITRLKSTTNANDPNAHYRLAFWKAAMRRSVDSPLIGNGFDRYPDDVVPPKTSRDRFPPSPHNSFVALGYRLGILPLLVLLLMLGHLLRRGFAAATDFEHPQDRAIASALTAIVTYVGIFSAFNVFLEAPYVGPLFWAAAGMLAVVCIQRPAAGKAPLTPQR